MLQCHHQTSKTTDVVDRTPPTPRLNYSELRALATERGLSRQLGKILERSGQDKKRRARKLSKGNGSIVNGTGALTGNCVISKNVPNDSGSLKVFHQQQCHDVFLGGSCNPTTWRHDIAIPLLESLNITYYNPQVSEWRSELVAVEHRAKETARVLLYVLDSSTRNVVGVIEAANFASTNRSRLVLVMGSYSPGKPIAGEHVSNREFEELCNGMATLKDIVERQGIPVFTDISEAIKCTASLLSSQEKFKLSKGHSLPEKLDQVQVGDKQFALKEAFDALDKNRSGEISLKDCCMAYEWLTSKTLSSNDLSRIIDHSKLKDSSNMKNNSEVMLNFPQFCEMVRKLRLKNGNCQSWFFPRRISADSIEISDKNSPQCCLEVLDLYIGGLDEQCYQSISDILQSSGVRFRISHNWSTWASKEGDLMDSAKLLLLVVPSTARALDTMAIASYYIGIGSEMILCIQNLVEGSIVSNEKLSKVSCSDYNRGRVYLTDEANRSSHVTVVNDLTEAVQCAIARLR